MGKILKTVALIGVAIGASLLAPGLGGVLAGAIQGAIGLTVSAAVSTAIASVVISLAVGLALQALAGTPKAGQPAPFNFRQAVGNSWIIIGKRRQGGQMVFFHPRVSGSDHFRYFIFAAAGHRCKGVTRWFLNDEEVTVGSGGLVTSGRYANNAWLWFGRGTSDTDETPSGWRSETGGKWTTDHKLLGVAKIYAKFKLTDDVIEAGMPVVTAEIEGADEIIDPRTGAAGYTNLATPATYWWMKLPREEGGFGLTDDDLPDDTILSAWTNVCDEDVALPGATTEKRYTINALIETGSEPSKLRQLFLLAQAGTFSEIDGIHMLRPGYWVPVSADLAEADLAGPIGIALLDDPQGYATEVNGTFIDPATNYQPQPIPRRSTASADIRQLDFDLPFTTSHTAGQRILEIMLRRANAEKQISWPMNIAGLAITPMQTVRCASDRYGLSNYAFTVAGWSMGADFGVKLALREENPEIYELPVEDYKAKAGTGTPAVPEIVPPASPGPGDVIDGQVPL